MLDSKCQKLTKQWNRKPSKYCCSHTVTFHNKFPGKCIMSLFLSSKERNNQMVGLSSEAHLEVITIATDHCHRLHCHRSLPGQQKVQKTTVPPDMKFVQNFTPPDFQAKNFTPSISPNFNSFSKKKHKKLVKIEKFTPLAKILQSRRHWRHGQIPPLRLSPNFCYSVLLWTFHVTPILYQSKCPASVRTIQIDIQNTPSCKGNPRQPNYK